MLKNLSWQRVFEDGSVFGVQFELFKVKYFIPKCQILEIIK